MRLLLLLHRELMFIYGHHTGQLVLTRTAVKKWRILLEQSCTSHMPLLTVTRELSFEDARVLHNRVPLINQCLIVVLWVFVFM